MRRSEAFLMSTNNKVSQEAREKKKDVILVLES